MTASQKTRTSDGLIASVIRFPARQAVIWIAREGGAWLVLAREHGWLHGDYDAALADARWLARNLGFTIRRAAP